MAFHTGEYDTYCLLGSPSATPIWHADAWHNVAHALDPLIDAARGSASVRSTQYLPKQSGIVKFGRIGWTQRGHEKWTHGSPASQEWQFLDTEVWAPSWSQCERDDQSPDLYFSVGNEALSGGFNERLVFNPVIILAVTTRIAQGSSEIVVNTVNTLARQTKARFVGHRCRPWGSSSGSGFTNSIQDLCASGLFRPGPRHDNQELSELLVDTWQPLNPESAV